MNILFIRRYKYTIHDSVDNVRSEIESIINTRWYDFSINLMGRFKNNDNFILSSKWSFTFIQWIEISPAYLSGTLTVNDNKTILDTSLRPNSFFILLFYLITVLFLCELFGKSMFAGEARTGALLFFPLVNLILFGLMLFYTTQLRDKFEKTLRLKRRR